MLTSFPAPVLSVAADAVRELEGTDALYGLWTLFTKCKESLQDGRRLENISWRLWFREMAKASPSRHLDLNEKDFAHEDQKFDEKQFRPLTPDEVHQLSTPAVSEEALGIPFFSSASVTPHTNPASRSPKSFSALSQSPSQFSTAVPITRRRLSSTRSGSFISGSGALSVGKIICDMLPNADSSEQRSVSSFSNFNNSTLDLRQNIQAPEPDTRPTLCLIPTPATTFLPPSCLPTPGTEEDDIEASFYESAISLTPHLSSSPPAVLVSFPAPVNPVTSIFTLPTLLEEPTSQSRSLPAFSESLLPSEAPPRLVVVNPTPNPTPHPTPPATPDLNPGIRNAIQGSQYLTLPNARQFSNLLHIPLSASRPRASSARSLHRLDAEDAEISALEYTQNLTLDSDMGEVSGHAEPSRLGMVPEESHPTTLPGSNNPGSPPRDWTTGTHRHSISSTATTSSSSQASSAPTTASTTTASTADESAKAPEEVSSRKGSVMSSSSSKRSSVSGTVSQSRSPAVVSSPTLASSPGSVKKKRHSMPVQSTAGSSSALSSTGRSGSLSSSKPLVSSPQKSVRPSAGLIRRASSGGGSASGSSKSRSRSRDTGTGLIMTRAVAKTVGGAKSKRPILGARVGRGRAVISLARKPSQGDAEDRDNDITRQKRVREETMQKELERRDLEREFELERDREREVKRLAKFNFGSNSEGSAMGSKSAGSGSEASGMVTGPTDQDQTQPELVHAVMRGVPGDQNVAWKGKEKERDYQVQQMLKYDDQEKERTQEKEIERGRQEREKVQMETEGRARAKETSVRTLKKSDEAAVAAATAAKVQRSLADPLLPLNQRRVVLATSESDYETDSEFDEDGSWSSEALSTEYVDVPVPRRQISKASLPRPEVRPQETQAPPQLSPRHQPRPQPQQAQQPQQPSPQQAAPPPQRQPQLSPRRAAPPQRPPGPQRTYSGAYHPGNTTVNATTRQRQQTNRAQHQRQEQRQAAQAARALFEATAELQRQQDMFVKLPTSSFQNLNGEVQRTKSVGLLSQLMKPDPEIFPPNHPYRRGFSFSEINHSQQQQLAAQRQAAIRQQEAQLLAHNHATTLNGQSHPPPPDQQPLPGPAQLAARHLPRQHGPMPALSRTPSKSAIAGPVASQVQAAGMERSVTAGFLGIAVVKGAWSAMTEMVGRGGKGGAGGGAHTATRASLGGVSGAADAGSNEEVINPNKAPVAENAGSAGPDVSSAKYRPRARPEDMELEDESDTEMDRIQLSTSVANERIKALTERRAPTRRQTLDGAVPLQRVPPESQVPAWPHETVHAELPQQIAVQRSAPILNQQIQLPQIVPFSTAIPVDHPYNFPLPPPPATPVTIRRTMLKDELTESMRRQILWQRQVGKANPIRRTASGGGSRNNVLGGLQPFTTAMPNVVQLTAKGSTAHPETNAAPTGRHNTDTSSGSAVVEAERNGRDARSADEERRRHAMARNRSWAGDFHHAGW